MFDVSLLELMTIFLVGMLVLKPRDIISIFTKFKNLNSNFTKEKFLDFKEIDMIEDKKNEFSFKDGNKKKER